MAIQRFEQDELVTSSHNVLVDLVDWLGFLCAKDYVTDLLRNTHQMSATESAKRAGKIIPHVRLAAGYVHQSQEGPPELSFLPAYYAILNLMKVYVLLGPRHADLSSNRHHGATYDVGGKDSHSVLTEEIKLKRNGVFPLFYEAITGGSLGNRTIILKVREFLPLVSGITHEYMHVTGQKSPFCSVSFSTVPHNNAPHIQAVVYNLAAPSTRESHPYLRGYTAMPGTVGMPASPAIGRIFRGPQILNGQDFWQQIRASLNTHLLYRVAPQSTHATICLGAKLQYPQEFPISLLFFYMSSVVRYRPEFFARLRDSKYWPLISVARYHAFLDFLLEFWSYVQRRNYFINPPAR